MSCQHQTGRRDSSEHFGQPYKFSDARLHPCKLVIAGSAGYEKGLALQEEAHALVAEGHLDGVLIFLEHMPVITIGRSGGRENIRINADELRARGVELCTANRGGNITCHAPGQLIGYPVLNLHKWTRDVHWYVHMLEEVIIRTLACYKLYAGRKARYTGVWLGDEKIAAIGVSVRRWVSGHGFALNINNDLDLFDAIVPCGIQEFGVTSMAKAGVDTNAAEVSTIVEQQFKEIFQCSFQDLA